MSEPHDPSGLRRFTFGDCPVDDWPPSGARTDAEPWRSFDLARSAMQRGDPAEAEHLWRGVADSADVESRVMLQAWHLLRSIGVGPPGDIAKHVLGVVAEVAVPDGHDLLAAYEDGSVRYLNYSGAATIIEERIPEVEAPARDLLSMGQEIAEAIGPWDGPLPPLPAGHSRITMLTPLGPHFGQGPDDVLGADPSAAAFLDAATRTLVAVVGLGR
jgi:hypothetical protein